MARLPCHARLFSEGCGKDGTRDEVELGHPTRIYSRDSIPSMMCLSLKCIFFASSARRLLAVLLDSRRLRLYSLTASP